MRETVLHLMCGKIAAGKSTLCAALGAEPGTIVVAEDAWLAALYPGEQNSLDDYLRNSSRLRAAIAPHLVVLLRAGLSMVLDFPANTRASRAWMRSVVQQAGVAHRLHFLDTPDDVCRGRMHRRNAAGLHPFAPTDTDFDLFTSYFEPPGADEGFEVVRYVQSLTT